MSQIILDDQLDPERVLQPLLAWTTVRRLRELRPGTVIKDDAIPGLLRQQKQVTFVTINVAHFWQRVSADKAFCIVCCALPQERQAEVPTLIRRLFRLPEFRTKAARMGKVIRVSETGIAYYQVGEDLIHHLPWPDQR